MFKKMNGPEKKRFWLTFWAYIIVALLLLGYFAGTMLVERWDDRDGYEDYLKDSPELAAKVEQIVAEKDPVEVKVGTYVENLRELNIKSSYYRVEFMVWFNWEGDAELDPAHDFRIYKGLENKRVVLEEVHEGNQHYQLVGVDASISKNFDTQRFPLESHQLRIYVESTSPIHEVVYLADKENSGMNPNLTISGFKLMRNDMDVVSYMYESTHGNPTVPKNEISSEVVTAFEINRANFGLYFKCFIALFGTVTWVLIALFICTYHHVDPLSMIPAALFGTVGNIMIGASLVPDALEMGLLEYVNFWGIITILGGAIAIININRVRKKTKDEDNQLFAKFYGRMLFYVLLFVAVSGQVILPLSAYIWRG